MDLLDAKKEQERDMDEALINYLVERRNIAGKNRDWKKQMKYEIY